ncbi:MAG: DUF2779 domain-containing protein [Bacteroidia bacterium]
MTNLLSKSKYKLATSCPTKLYYALNSKQYPNSNDDNDFLQSLAEGGYQIGKLATYKFSFLDKIYSIETLKPDEAVKQTNEALKHNEVIIYEAAFKYDNLFIRADVLVKQGNKIEIYEVKAKSYSKAEDADFINKNKGNIMPKWAPYLYDIAFQKYVVVKCMPNADVGAFLTLVNKDHVCTKEGLNKLFKVQRDLINNKSDADNIIRRRIYIKTPEHIKAEDLDLDLLINVNVDDIIENIWNKNHPIDFKNPQLNNSSYTEQLNYLANACENNIKIEAAITSKCKYCEFHKSPENIGPNEKSGRWECLKNAWNLKEEDQNKSMLFNLYNGFSSNEKFLELVSQKKYFLKDVTENDLLNKEEIKKRRKGEDIYNIEEFTNTERRFTQCLAENNTSQIIYLKQIGLKAQLKALENRYPIHFIDFETIASAIPHHKGLKPYQVIAFQYSHHVLYKDGTLKHFGEWINLTKGAFPSFEFVRNLKNELQDGHPIFRYSHHENTVLNDIAEQLENSNEKDKNELIAFIKTITRNKAENHTGENNMIDLCEWIKKYYYNPLTKGSNSIKKVLPAVMATSEYVKEKYSKPYYSNNFKDGIVWYKTDEHNKPIDPYKLLPPLTTKLLNTELEDDQEDESTYEEKSINSGGPAMAAYAEMQFDDMDETTFNEYKNALLRYCELDTLAMVMIYEHLREIV